MQSFKFYYLKARATFWSTGQTALLRVDKGAGLGVPLLIIKKTRRTQMHPTPQFWVYKSFYKHFNQPVPELPPSTKNLFAQLAENIAGSLGISSCYVYGRTNMGNQWPWEAKELMPQDNFTSPNPASKSTASARVWLLKASIIGKYCIAWWGKAFTEAVGETTCLRYSIMMRLKTKLYGDTPRMTTTYQIQTFLLVLYSKPLLASARGSKGLKGTLWPILDLWSTGISATAG